MWPVMLGVGLITLIAKVFSDDRPVKTRKTKADLKRIFISFAIENELYIDHLVNQARLESSSLFNLSF
jgi:hypothetical protein